MKKSKKRRKKRTPKHIPIGYIKPEIVAAIEEPLVVAAVPKSLWQKFLDWIDGAKEDY